LSKSYFLFTLINKSFHLINGPNLPFPLDTGRFSYSAIGAFAALFSLIKAMAFSNKTSSGSIPFGIETFSVPN
jgi:hypothetical protein